MSPRMTAGRSDGVEKCAEQIEFQSAPDINAGRSHGQWIKPRTARLFQSAPDINAGRSCLLRHCCTAPRLFQSAPDINAGRSLGGTGSVRPRRVSIRARHQCRAIRHEPHWVIDVHQFQSAPDINAGRSQCSGYDYCYHQVSIRARHQCRAIHGTSVSP